MFNRRMHSVVLVGSQQVVGCHGIIRLILENRVLHIINWVAELGQCSYSIVIYRKRTKARVRDIPFKIDLYLLRLTVK